MATDAAVQESVADVVTDEAIRAEAHAMVAPIVETDVLDALTKQSPTQRLRGTLRTVTLFERCFRRRDNPARDENVLEHIGDMVRLSLSLWRFAPYLSLEKLLVMAAVHEEDEAFFVGSRDVDIRHPYGKRLKTEIEVIVAPWIEEMYADHPLVLEMRAEYCAGNTGEARFEKACDAYAPMRHNERSNGRIWKRYSDPFSSQLQQLTKGMLHPVVGAFMVQLMYDVARKWRRHGGDGVKNAPELLDRHIRAVLNTKDEAYMAEFRRISQIITKAIEAERQARKARRISIARQEAGWLDIESRRLHVV